MRRVPSILFVHDNFPAQFGDLGDWLAQTGWQVAFATAADAPASSTMRILAYRPHREPSPQAHPYAQTLDRAAITAQAFVRAALAARDGGYHPDIVVAHSGWGAGMFAKDVFPDAAFVPYCEWWYRHPGPDVQFLADLAKRPVTGSVEAPMRERARNAPIAMDLASADAALCPTRYQAAQFPTVFRAMLNVQHDGINTVHFAPDPRARTATLGGQIAPDAHLVTYATRGMEPHRGFPQFMAALPRILAADPKATAVIAGDNRVAYGGDTVRKTDWKARALAENDIDPGRVRFTGRLGRRDYLRLLQRSDAHVYLTVPFVLSWSMLEAMSTGCALVLSDTDPVREFADADSARLVDIADIDALANAVLETLADPADQLRARARAVIRDTLDARRLFARKADLFRSLCG